jgi:hypothetical protein
LVCNAARVATVAVGAFAFGLRNLFCPTQPASQALDGNKETGLATKKTTETLIDVRFRPHTHTHTHTHTQNTHTHTHTLKRTETHALIAQFFPCAQR